MIRAKTEEAEVKDGMHWKYGTVEALCMMPLNWCHSVMS